MRRSDCVPLPTPGAPTRMMRAAFFNFLDAAEMLMVYEADWIGNAEDVGGGRACAHEAYFKCP